VEVVGAKAGDADGDEDESKADDPMWQPLMGTVFEVISLKEKSYSFNFYFKK